MANDIRIKEEIINLCDDFVVFWNQLKEEIALIDDHNDVDLVLQWHNYFVEHGDITTELNMIKRHVENIEEKLIKTGELKCEYDR